MRTARRLGRAAAITLVAGTVGGAALLAAEAVAARARRYAQPTLGLALRSTVGDVAAPPLRLVLLGDSAAMGVGVDRLADTVGGRLAAMLTRDCARRVELSSVAVAGSRSADLATQVARALLATRPDVALILVGAKDATGLRRPSDAAAHVAAAVRRLREAGAGVVLGTCPDLGAAWAFAPPLRQVIGWLGQQVARAQARAALEAGASVVDLATETGPVFRADPGTLCADGYHPSADGYQVWAHALYPAVAAAAADASRR
ncbi:MAG TPA: SGNH/GDSL hydrolase family protein [Micromonosporaceae bacterium]|nr:SGNH/GDSL hydrolase family protein [Micromonosporaceae bacterium]